MASKIWSNSRCSYHSGHRSRYPLGYSKGLVMMNSTSYSMTQTFSRCPRSFWYKYVCNLQRIRRDKAMYQGSLMHGGLQEFFIWYRDTGDSVKALLAAASFFQEQYSAVAEDPNLFNDEKDEWDGIIGDSEQIVMDYLGGDNIPEDWTVLHVEEEFVVLLESGDTVTFTPDLVIETRDGEVFVVDHKSTSDSVPEELPQSDLQVLMYSAGMREMYPNFAGFIFNYLRKKLPTVPRLNTTKPKAQGHYSVNNLNKIDTTYKMLRDFLMAEAPHLMNDDDHRRRLAELYGKNAFYWQGRVLVNSTAMDIALEEVRMKLNQMKHAAETGEYPRNLVNSGYSTCERCEFQVLCHNDLLGRNTELVINEYYEERSAKNPYEEADSAGS